MLACLHQTFATFMRRSVSVVLSSTLRLSWLRSLSRASCSWSSDRRKASGRGSSSARRPSSSLRTSSISFSTSPRTTWASCSTWARREQYSSASARVFSTWTVMRTGLGLDMKIKSIDHFIQYLDLIAVQQTFILLDGSFDLLEFWLRQGQLLLHCRCCNLTGTHVIY